MTHTRAMSESEGTLSEAAVIDRACPKCEKGRVLLQLWESDDGAYEDEKFTCPGCGHVWWIDGIDS